MMLNPNLPIVSDMPYQEGTAHAVLSQTPEGDLVVAAVFGNAFNATHVPLTMRAARELHRQLTDALRDAHAARL